MRLILFAIALLLINGSAFAAEFSCKKNFPNLKNTPRTELTVKEAKAEIDCIVDLLRNVHPNFNAHITRKAFQKIARGLKKRIKEPQKIEDLFTKYTSLVSAVCDEHTIVQYPDRMHKTFDSSEWGFPSRLYIATDNLYAKMNNTYNLDARFTENVLKIHSINHVKADELGRYLKSQTAIDGCVKNRKYLLPTIHVQRSLTNLFNKPSKYLFHATTRNSSAEWFLVEPSSALDLFKQVNTPSGSAAFPVEHHGFKLKARTEEWRYYLNRRKKTGYLYVGGFTEISQNDIRKIMRQVIADKSEKLIVDLSDNPGGQLRKSMLMNSFLIPRAHKTADYVVAKRHTIYRPKDLVWETTRKKEIIRQLRQFKRAPRRGGLRKLHFRKESFGNPHFRGQLFVLISHNTGSAAAASTFVLKDNRPDTKLIGYKTHGGGRTGCFSPQSSYQLPYSHLRLHVPRSCWRRTGKLAKRYAHSIIPDILVQPDPDYIDEYGKSLMAFALNYVANPDKTRAR